MPAVKRGAIARLCPALLVLLATAAQAQVGLATFSSSQSGVSGYIAILDLGSGSFTPVVSGLDTTCRERGDSPSVRQS